MNHKIMNQSNESPLFSTPSNERQSDKFPVLTQFVYVSTLSLIAFWVVAKSSIVLSTYSLKRMHSTIFIEKNLVKSNNNLHHCKSVFVFVCIRRMTVHFLYIVCGCARFFYQVSILLWHLLSFRPQTIVDISSVNSIRLPWLPISRSVYFVWIKQTMDFQHVVRLQSQKMHAK